LGSLSLPSRGSVYLDANSVIYSVEGVEPYRTLLEPLWLSSGPATFRLVSSELTLLEVLVSPLKTGNVRLEMNFRAILQKSSDVQLLPITSAILERAAQL
jgi:PIN domain-containing protein